MSGSGPARPGRRWPCHVPFDLGFVGVRVSPPAVHGVVEVAADDGRPDRGGWPWSSRSSTSIRPRPRSGLGRPRSNPSGTPSGHACTPARQPVTALRVALVHRDLHVTTRGGIGTLWRALAPRLRDADHEVALITQHTSHPLALTGIR